MPGFKRPGICMGSGTGSSLVDGSLFYSPTLSLQLGKLADAEKILIEAQSRLDGTEFCIETASIREQRILFEDSISFSVRNGLKLGSGGRSLG
jgi:hypothetical protein